MARVERPFPPGDYPVVIVGTGPGGLQTSYSLRRLGVEHALLSRDDGPGGMFQRFPLFQRLITWTKPHTPFPRGTRDYERFDWNSLLADEDGGRALVPQFMDDSSYFPSREAMHQGIAAFAQETQLAARYGCSWDATTRTEEGFVVHTSDGDYSCKVAVFAVGATEPWKPDIPGIDEIPHYVETKEPKNYRAKRVFIVGKRNSGFEIADGLLPWASQIILGSPRPARMSVIVHSTAAARARYLQPYEDHVLGGGNFVLDATIERIEKTERGSRVFTKGTTRPGDLVFDVDEVIAATGFTTPLRDLPQLGVATFHQDRLPAQTPYWESASTPGIYFAGSATQGSIGLKKYGIPSNSAAVHGFRYNARALAAHIATEHFGVRIDKTPIPPRDLVDYLLAEATRAPELWNQQSYLARVVSFADGAPGDEGIQPLAHFVDADAPDAVAITIETDDSGDIHPAVYVRRQGRVSEHLLTSDPLLNFETAEHRRQLGGVIEGLFG